VKHELGFDACIDYKSGALREELKAACPKGVDVYFDNVGGEILDTVLTRMNLFGRVVVCGTISDYSSAEILPHVAAIFGPRTFRAAIDAIESRAARSAYSTRS